MIKTATNIALTLLLLFATVGFFAVKSQCDMLPVEMAIHSGPEGCCPVLDMEIESTIPVAEMGGCSLQHHGHTTCTSNGDEPECSCDTGSDYFTTTEIITIKKPYTNILLPAGPPVPYLEGTMAVRANSQTSNILTHFSLPKVRIDAQSEFGVFIC